MIKIDFNFDLKDLNDTPLPGNSNAGQFVASLLMGENKGEAIKLFDWAMALNKKQSISVDAADFNKIKDFINDCDKMTLLAKAQLLKYLETIKKE